MSAVHRVGIAKPRISDLFAFAWLAIAAATFVMLLVTVYATTVEAPIAEEWFYADPHVYLRDLFVKNTIHPFVIGRLGLALDYWLVDASGWFVRGLSIVLAALDVVAVLWIGWLSGARSFFGQAAIGAFAIIVVFAAIGIQNFSWGMQFAFISAWASTTGSLGALASYAAKPARWKLALASVLCVTAMLGLGNGALVGFILAAMAWRLGLQRRVVIGLILLGILCMAAFIAMPVNETTTVPARLSDAPTIITFALRVLGGVPGGIFGDLQPIGAPTDDKVNLALVMGVIELALAALLSYRAVFAKTPNPGRLAAVGIIFFAFVSAAAIGLSRFFLGQPQALSSRYAIVSATFLIGILLLVWPSKDKIAMNARSIAALAAATFLAAVVPYSALGEIQQRRDIEMSQVRSQTALVVGLPRPGYLRIFRSLEEVMAGADWFRAHKKSLFRDQWSRSLGQNLTPAPTDVCAGDAFISPPFEDAPQFADANGSIDAEVARNGRIVVIVDANKVIAGYGLVPKAVRNLIPFSYPPEARLHWMGTARAATGPYTAYLASPQALLCRIG